MSQMDDYPSLHISSEKHRATPSASNQPNDGTISRLVFAASMLAKRNQEVESEAKKWC
ncbi:hypothetical protein ABEW05_009073 [Botrytis cinerea]